ncbi:hypothetical protein MMC10_002219 [Thelotrema lepadinum]|nr:hypothetical protein [Thelotrema lepadinum]
MTFLGFSFLKRLTTARASQFLRFSRYRIQPKKLSNRTRWAFPSTALAIAIVTTSQLAPSRPLSNCKDYEDYEDHEDYGDNGGSHSASPSTDPPDTIYFVKITVPAHNHWRLEGPFHTVNFAAAVALGNLKLNCGPDVPDHIFHKSDAWLFGKPVVIEAPLTHRNADPALKMRFELVKVRSPTVAAALPAPTWHVEFVKHSREAFDRATPVPDDAAANVTVSSIHKSKEDAWEAARGQAEAIREMEGGEVGIGEVTADDVTPDGITGADGVFVYGRENVWIMILRYEDGERLRATIADFERYLESVAIDTR